MNVFKFFLHVEAKNAEGPILRRIQEIYKNSYTGDLEYSTYIKQQWNEWDSTPNVMALFSDEEICAYCNIWGNNYYIVDTRPSNDNGQSSFDVFVFTDNNITFAYNEVYQHINNKLKKTLDLSIEKPKIGIYIWDTNDIIDPLISIEADIINTKKVSKVEIIRWIVIGVLFVASIIILVCNDVETPIGSVSASVVGSIVLLIGSEIVIKVIKPKKTVELQGFEKGWLNKENSRRKPETVLKSPKVEGKK